MYGASISYHIQGFQFSEHRLSILLVFLIQTMQYMQDHARPCITGALHAPEHWCSLPDLPRSPVVVVMGALCMCVCVCAIKLYDPVA